ncbi:unnamed protein product, partial (mitochondrion) [Sympodiomycopsis kandeliae]
RKDKLSLNITRCGKILWNIFLFRKLDTIFRIIPIIVKMPFYNFYIKKIRGQSAWYKNIIPSETKRNAFYSIFRKTDKKSEIDKFHKWLCGVVDGDGTFYFSKTRDNYWTFYFKVGQSNYNLRILYFIKTKLGYGSVNVPNSKDNIAEFRIRDQIVIIKVILPIFDKYPLLTSKQFNYEIFREALLINTNKKISLENRNIELEKLKSMIKPVNFVSKVFHDTFEFSKGNVETIISKEWLVGFTEAEGSFYLVRKGSKRIAHIFEITQKLDKIVLEAIAVILDMKVVEKSTYNTVLTCNQKSIYRVIEYFNGQIKGIKAVEYRIWSRSFNKKYSFEELIKIQEQIRRLRSTRNHSFPDILILKLYYL